MLLMAKKKPEKNRSRSQGLVRPISVEIDPKLADALDACAAKRRQTKKVVITTALEELLSREGFWPPSDSPDED